MYYKSTPSCDVTLLFLRAIILHEWSAAQHSLRNSWRVLSRLIHSVARRSARSSCIILNWVKMKSKKEMGQKIQTPSLEERAQNQPSLSHSLKFNMYVDVCNKKLRCVRLSFTGRPENNLVPMALAHTTIPRTGLTRGTKHP